MLGVISRDLQKLPSRRKHTPGVILEPRAVLSNQRLTSGFSIRHAYFARRIRGSYRGALISQR